MISSVENGDDHTHSFHTIMWKNKNHTIAAFCRREYKKTFSQTPSMGSSNSRWPVQWDCLNQAGTRHLSQHSPYVVPFPLPLPSVPYYISASLPFSLLTHTPPFPHTPFLQNLSDPPSHYLWSAGTVVQFLSVGSRSALGVVPERWSAQWQLHWGDTARCCCGALLLRHRC